MIAKITRGGSFGGAARYVLDERRGLDHDHQPQIIGGNMAGRTSGELTREFEAVRLQRPRADAYLSRSRLPPKTKRDS